MTPTAFSDEHTVEPDVDVLIVGAGLSGIGAATRLRSELPGTSFVVVDARERVGGTWDLFRYPGIRSDSDLITYGYSYLPWTKEQAIAAGGEIRSYLDDAVTSFGLQDCLRLGRRVVRAAWSSASARWSVSMIDLATGRVEVLTARWLFSAAGYFDHKSGYQPDFAGLDDFAGTVVHPQHWPADLDHTGRQVVVIGSGATAMTMLPAMAGAAAHVTMLQRSPSYVLPLPSRDLVFCALKRVLPTLVAFRIARLANIQRLRVIVGLSRRYPRTVRRFIRAVTKALLPRHFDVDTHFRPRYDPWDQRMCLVPDGDLFAALRAGTASVVTDRVARFVADGIELESGQFLRADLVVTATGMNLLPFGGIEAVVDGQVVAWPETVTFRSMMVSGVPNFAYALGYTNNSWTLKLDLVTLHWCRLLAHMQQHAHTVVTPTLDDPDMPREQIMNDLTSGYVERGTAAFPRQGTSGPWTAAMHYATDRIRLSEGPVEDDCLVFGPAAGAAPEPASERTGVVA